MAEPNEIANGDKPVAQESKTEAKSELPVVESPPLSPAEKLSEPVLDQQMKSQPAPEVKPEPAVTMAAETAKSRFAMPNIKMPALKIPAMKMPEMKIAVPKISRRNRRRAALAATIMLAAGFGAAVGAVAMRQPKQPPAKTTIVT